jgi:diguanylate cyclase (GGDEF)-like protein/PAS domain S-box-containing protein
MHAHDPSPDLYRQLLDCSSDPIFSFSLDYRFLYANQAFADGIGRNLDEVVGRTVWDVFSKDEADRRIAIVQWVFDHAEAKTYEILIQGRVGSRYYLTTVTPMLDDQGQVSSVLANSKDITERKLAESVLKASEEKYRALIETTNTGYLILDAEGRVIDANSEYVRLTGYSRLEEIVGKSVLEWTAVYETEKNAAAVAQCARDGFIKNLVIDYVDRNDRITPVEINAKVIGHGDSIQIISLCRDITERKQAEDQVRQLAFHDALTKLPNRRLLDDRLRQAMVASKRHGCYGAAMFLDLDNFKPLNDQYGHKVGDMLLIEAADRLKKCIREMDTVARFGGDEFVVIISELAADKAGSINQATAVAEKIRLAISEPYRLRVILDDKPESTVEHHCTVTIGAALFIDQENGQDDILKWADTAMYEAKAAGRNRVQFFDANN